MKKQEVKKKKFLEIYENNMCNITNACKIAGICRETFYNWKEQDTEFRKRVEYAEETVLDFAETMLVKNIREGKETSLIFFLKTKGKNRGYVERIENNVTVNPFEELMKRVTDERGKTNKEDA